LRFPLSDNFFTADFSKKCVDLMNKYPDVAVGLIAQSRLEDARPEVIQVTSFIQKLLQNYGSMLRSQFSAIFAIFLQK
jgi:hypothetical protein